MEEMPVIGAHKAVGGGAARQEAVERGLDVDALARKTQQGRNEDLIEVDRVVVLVKAQVRPAQRQQASGDRAAGDAGDLAQERQEPELVETNECARVIDHRAVAPARKTKTNGVIELASLQEIDFRGMGREQALNVLRYCEIVHMAFPLVVRRPLPASIMLSCP